MNTAHMQTHRYISISKLHKGFKSRRKQTMVFTVVLPVRTFFLIKEHTEKFLNTDCVCFSMQNTHHASNLNGYTLKCKENCKKEIEKPTQKWIFYLRPVSEEANGQTYNQRLCSGCTPAYKHTSWIITLNRKIPSSHPT